MAKKKILIGLTYYLPNTSGLTNHVKVLAQGLAKRGHRVEIISTKFRPELKTKEVINGVTAYRIPGITIGKGILSPGYAAAAWRAVRKAEVINCHLPSVEAWWLALWAKVLKKRLVVTYHCLFDSGMPYLNRIIELNHRVICGWADKIVVNTKDYITGNGLLKGQEDKMVQILPPFEFKKPSKTEQQEIKKKLTGLEGKKIIGFLGRISREKNVELLIEAAKKVKEAVPEVAVVLAGPEEVLGEQDYQKKIEKLLQENKKLIVRIGRVTNPVAFFERCEVTVLPSNNKLESYGLVQVESMLAGTPVTAPNRPGVRVPVSLSGMGEIFEDNNAADLADKLVKVIKRGKNSYSKNIGNKLFNVDLAISEYIKLFSN